MNASLAAESQMKLTNAMDQELVRAGLGAEALHH
jgi:hypothetical protein